MAVIDEQRLWSPYGEQGYMVTGDGGWQVFGPDDKPVESAKSTDRGDITHLQNFIDCVKSRRRPNADIEEGHLSAALCHLGNIAHRTGRTIRFQSATETILGDPDASRLLARTYRAPWTLPKVGG